MLKVIQIARTEDFVAKNMCTEHTANMQEYKFIDSIASFV